MSRLMRIQNPGKSQGLSLIELMIAMAIGLVLTLAMTHLLTANRTSYSTVLSQAQIAENGRAALYLVGSVVRLAGYWDDNNYRKQFAAEAGFKSDAVVTGKDNDSTETDVVDGTDTVSVRLGGAEDEGIMTCNGTKISETQMAVQRLYLGPAAGSERVPTLYCEITIYAFNAAMGTMTSPQKTETVPLINGIENMQLLYGMGDSNKLQLLPASKVTDWTKVTSVSVAFLATSGDNVPGTGVSRSYKLFDETVKGVADGRPRRVMEQVIMLRNTVPGL